jgi:YegS C-terminal NAD kinase beta sandwich-like domain
MTVRRGETWGEALTDPIDAVEARSDPELAGALNDRQRRPVLLRGGDLHRSLGAPAAAAATMRVPIDLISVRADGTERTAVAHVIARRQGRLGWWRGPIVAVMNVDHAGVWDVAPRAHPNDGWLDVIEVSESMSLRSRWQAWRRLRTGNHVPHPDITARRVRTETFTFGSPLGVWVDGVERGTVRSLLVEVEPDGAEVYV